MFGGLELKGSTGGESKEDAADASAAPAPAASGFSFLAPAAAATSEASAAPPSSSFSFLNPATSGAAEAATDTAPALAAAAPSSGFGFMATPAVDAVADAAPTAVSSSFDFLKSTANATAEGTATTATTDAATEPATAASSGFGFMAASEPAVSIPEPSATDAPAPSEIPAPAGSGFGFMATKAPSVVNNTPSATSPSRESSAPSLLNITTSSSGTQPVGSGIVFGGAAVHSKKPVKKRTRTAKIGAAAQQQAATSSLPAPSAAVSLPPPSAVVVPTPPSVAQSPSSDSATRDAAAEASRRADAFMQSKAATEAAAAATEAPPALETVLSQDDDVILAAKAAAAKAHKLEAQKSSRFSGLFRSRAKSPPTHNTGMARSAAPSSLSSNRETSSMNSRMERQPSNVSRDGSIESSSLAVAPVAALSVTVPPVPRVPTTVVATQKLTMSSTTTTTTTATSNITVTATPDVLSIAKAVTPTDTFHELLDDFKLQVVVSMEQVSRLRQHRSGLLEERFVTTAKERLAVQQAAQARDQQMAAAQEEDFDTAESLSVAIERHDREQSEYAAILQSIGRALEELDQQTLACVAQVTKCFGTVQTQLAGLQKELEDADAQTATETLASLTAVSKQLSAEHARLQQDQGHLERDTALVADERTQLETAISEQAGEFEVLRDEARNKLTVVEEEMEELRLQLQNKQKVAAQLRTEAAGHDEAVLRVRVKFARQLTRLQKKEMTLRDNQEEWETEQAALEAQKAQHEVQVQAHSEAMLARDKLLDTLHTQVEMADTFESIVAKEIGFDVHRKPSGQNDTEQNGDDQADDSEHSDELAHMQANVVKCEAAANEGKAALAAVTTARQSLVDEAAALTAQLPLLEELKKAAAAKRDFKAAGKASKDIKEATSRLAECEVLERDAAEQETVAQKRSHELTNDLDDARALANSKEKESAVVTMAKLADNIKRLVATKESVCGDAEERSIPGVGALVLNAQIEALTVEGQTYGDKYGGWDELMTEIGVVSPSSKKDTVSKASSLKDSTPSESPDADPVALSSAVENTMSAKEKMNKFRAVTKGLKECEDKLEAAVTDEDYDTAAELDVVLQNLLAEVEGLNMTDEEMELALANPEPSLMEGATESDETATTEEKNNQERKNGEVTDEKEDSSSIPPKLHTDTEDAVNGDELESKDTDDHSIGTGVAPSDDGVGDIEKENLSSDTGDGPDQIASESTATGTMEEGEKDETCDINEKTVAEETKDSADIVTGDEAVAED